MAVSRIPGYKFIHVHLSAPTLSKRVKINFVLWKLRANVVNNVMNASLSIIFNTRFFQRINIILISCVNADAIFEAFEFWIKFNLRSFMTQFSHGRSLIFITGAFAFSWHMCDMRNEKFNSRRSNTFFRRSFILLLLLNSHMRLLFPLLLRLHPKCPTSRLRTVMQTCMYVRSFQSRATSKL